MVTLVIAQAQNSEMDAPSKIGWGECRRSLMLCRTWTGVLGHCHSEDGLGSYSVELGKVVMRARNMWCQ